MALFPLTQQLLSLTRLAKTYAWLMSIAAQEKYPWTVVFVGYLHHSEALWLSRMWHNFFSPDFIHKQTCRSFSVQSLWHVSWISVIWILNFFVCSCTCCPPCHIEVTVPLRDRLFTSIISQPLYYLSRNVVSTAPACSLSINTHFS